MNETLILSFLIGNLIGATLCYFIGKYKNRYYRKLKFSDSDITIFAFDKKITPSDGHHWIGLKKGDKFIGGIRLNDSGITDVKFDI